MGFLPKIILLLLALCSFHADASKLEESPYYNYNPKVATANKNFNESLPQPKVTLSQGTYLGRSYRSRGGRIYDAFVGIRYAKPVERFQQIADFPEPSTKVRNATSYGPFCLQHDWFKSEIRGDEDCLYINIYKPQIEGGESRLKMPVMMYIHGGAFLFGSGNVYLPDYLMDQDHILVTMNYRLGVLGFLSTRDSEISGNMGLKDQIVALRWVQANIHLFQGDAKRVNIFGESAGGASVAYHMLSPMAKGLFVGGISHSGTALCPWAFVRDAKSVAYKLGALLDCPTNSSKELVNCLRQMDPRYLVTSQEKLTIWNRDPFAMFAPSAEFVSEEGSESGKKEEIYLSESPYQVLCHGRQNKIPWILGVCSDEGLTFHAAGILHNRKLTQELNTNWTRIAPVTLLFQDTARSVSYISKKLRKYYLGDHELLPLSLPKKEKASKTSKTSQQEDEERIMTQSLRNLTNLYSDRYFFHCTKTAASLNALKAPTYLYHFSYSGKYSLIQSLGIPKYGVAHGDDLQYFFPYSRFPYLNVDSESGRFSLKVIKLWTTFAETGIPVYEDEEGVEKEWKPLGESECINDGTCGKEDIEWLNLDLNISLKYNLYEDRMRFWDYLPLHEHKGEREVS